MCMNIKVKNTYIQIHTFPSTKYKDAKVTSLQSKVQREATFLKQVF